MSFWDWVASPEAIDLEHAVIGLIVAVTAWLSWRTHQRVKHNGSGKR